MLVATGANQNGLKRSPDDPVLPPECENMLHAMVDYASSKVAVFRKAYAGDSRSAAMQAKCLECVSYSTRDVRECTIVTCPLWSMRPYQTIRTS